ncbi:hypothetical protein [Nonomuraea sp. CA-141351]|uniref:hypothetical protein n=1 Tax=Nonomuraea sp. CA-141351 TaxID=3239996 RepID=UPI003D926EF2
MWVMIEFGEVQGMTLLTNKPYRLELTQGFCFTTTDDTTLPGWFSLGDWKLESRVQLVTLYRWARASALVVLCIRLSHQWTAWQCRWRLLPVFSEHLAEDRQKSACYSR